MSTFVIKCVNQSDCTEHR